MARHSAMNITLLFSATIIPNSRTPDLSPSCLLEVHHKIKENNTMTNLIATLTTLTALTITVFLAQLITMLSTLIEISKVV